MMRDDGPAVLQKTERIFEFAAHGEDWRRSRKPIRQHDRRGSIAARTTQHAGGAGHDTDHRIIHAAHDIAVVHEDGIGDT